MARITCPDYVEDAEALRAIVLEYLGGALEGFPDGVGTTPDAHALADTTLSNLGAYLPPRGRLLMAHDAAGALVGTSFVKRIRSDVAEIKRLYVRPAARGTGLGFRLMEATEEAAREIGCAQILLDTGAWMTAARRLYASMGYAETGRYDESENGPELEPHLVYYVKDLGAGR